MQKEIVKDHPIYRHLRNPNPMVRQLGFGSKGTTCNACVFFEKGCVQRRSARTHSGSFDACGIYKELAGKVGGA